MPISVQCPTCKRKTTAPDSALGINVRCKCGTTFLVAETPQFEIVDDSQPKEITTQAVILPSSPIRNLQPAPVESAPTHAAGVLRKETTLCAGCQQTVPGFFIPDGRFICPNCAPPAVYKRWDDEWAPIQKQIEKHEKAKNREMEREAVQRESAKSWFSIPRVVTVIFLLFVTAGFLLISMRTSSNIPIGSSSSVEEQMQTGSETLTEKTAPRIQSIVVQDGFLLINDIKIIFPFRTSKWIEHFGQPNRSKSESEFFLDADGITYQAAQGWIQAIRVYFDRPERLIGTEWEASLPKECYKGKFLVDGVSGNSRTPPSDFGLTRSDSGSFSTVFYSRSFPNFKIVEARDEQSRGKERIYNIYFSVNFQFNPENGLKFDPESGLETPPPSGLGSNTDRPQQVTERELHTNDPFRKLLSNLRVAKKYKERIQLIDEFTTKFPDTDHARAARDVRANVECLHSCVTAMANANIELQNAPNLAVDIDIDKRTKYLALTSISAVERSLAEATSLEERASLTFKAGVLYVSDNKFQSARNAFLDAFSMYSKLGGQFNQQDTERIQLNFYNTLLSLVSQVYSQMWLDTMELNLESVKPDNIKRIMRLLASAESGVRSLDYVDQKYRNALLRAIQIMNDGISPWSR